MAVVTPTAKAQFIDAAGIPLAGGLLYTYAAGTTTPQTTYTDSAGTTPNSNPIVLDSRGEANIWLGSATYKFKLTDANNTEIWTVDNISAPTSGVSPVLSGNVTISSDSPGTALTITQIGTGLALKVEDQSSDPTPTVIDSSGKVGIGTLSPATALDVNDGTIQLSSSGTSRATLAADASNTTLTSVGTRGLILNANSTNLIYGTSSGYVGIKNASPTVELDVTGAVKTSGNITGGAAISSTGAITAGSTLASTTTLTAGSSLTVTTSATIGTTLSVDTIQEKTSSAGVTVGGVLCKNALIPASANPITAETATATTSGSSVEFTGIPSWVKRITVILDNVGLNASSGNVIVQLGTASAYATSGYVSSCNVTVSGAGATQGNSSTAGFIWFSEDSARTMTGIMTICLLNASTNLFVESVSGRSGPGYNIVGGGDVTLSAALTRVKITTTASNTFTSGSVNIFYE